MTPNCLKAATWRENRKIIPKLGETLYINGNGFSPSTTYSCHIVVDQQNWTNGMAITERVVNTTDSIVTNAEGAIEPTNVRNNPQTIGNYDIVIDVNGNAQYEAYVDTLDDNDVEITAGFVIPEFSTWIILPLVVIVAVVMVYKKKLTKYSRVH